MKKKIREKRKDLSGKEAIINKEKEDEQLLKTIRDRESILIQTRHLNMMKGQQEKVKHVEGLEQWVARGFSTTRSTKKNVKVNLSQTPRLESLSKKMAMPIKLKTDASMDME